MSLTGGTFLTLVAVLTAGAFVAAVLAWPRLAGRSAGRVAARVGTLLLVNVLVLLTAATQLNAQFLFFADWVDLKGALSGTVTTTKLARGTSASAAAARQVRGDAASAPGRLPGLPTGVVDTAAPLRYTVRGQRSGLVGTVLVQLPPGYTDRSRAGVRYPVIETFHGYPGTPQQWLSSMNLPGVVAQEVVAGRMRPTLIVAPQIQFPAGVDTECTNARAGYPQLETWLTRDVPSWVARTFRVRTDRSSWATIGLSAGGWCAAMATMLHPAQYAAAVVLGGYFRPEFGALYEPYPPGSPLAVRYDLVLLAHRRPPPVALWLETSHTDPVSYSSSAALLKWTRPPTAVDAIVLQHAGHRISLWQSLLPGAMTWLGANVPGFAPVRP